MTKWSICHICGGDGTHVNPNIDCNGLSREDFDADPDFAESYMSGLYDVRCDACGGTGKVRTTDIEALDEDLREAADDRELAAREDGVWEPGLRDRRFGGRAYR